MPRKDHTVLSLTRQYKLRKIGRSSLYCIPVGTDAETLKLMTEIDRVFTKYPFFGSRQMAPCHLAGFLPVVTACVV
ncbi:hypothetical protein [Puniceibacterium confluentis]|uniref:hypothetical protein n=1 Tax=Puniceibacterium confluentis TaxID=1958944 RepID=UPI00356181DF